MFFWENHGNYENTFYKNMQRFNIDDMALFKESIINMKILVGKIE